MAKGPMGFTFTTFLVVLIFSLLPVSLCRSLFEPFHATTFLDVSATLERAQKVLTFDPQTLKQFHQLDHIFPTNSSFFSLRLHSREALRNSRYSDYKSLVLSRLQRDSARVNSLNAKLYLALNDLKNPHLKSFESVFRPYDMNTPVVSGKSRGSGEYFCRIGVGEPAKTFYMVPDTGSDVNWLQCQPCQSCFNQSDPIFDPTSSSSYGSLSCESQQCQALRESDCASDQCRYQVSYGDGSATAGELVTETLSFGDSGSVNNIALGCGHDNEGLFVEAAGLLGLGGGPLSLTSQIKASSFSYCLVDRDSVASSSLEFNSTQSHDPVTTPLLKNGKLNTFYYIGLTGISVGGELLPIPPSVFRMDKTGYGGTIIDSGTTITRLRTRAYDSLRDAFVKRTHYLPLTEGVELLDTCYDLSSEKNVQVPNVSFHFPGGMSLHLPAKNFLIPVDSNGTFCLAFAPTTSSLSIIGNVQQQGTRVSFDLAKSRIGFSPNRC